MSIDAMKHALVTGASRGIGAQFVRTLTERGWTALGTARQPDADHLVALDVGDPGSIEQLATTLAGRVPQLDLLVNCAGINSKSNRPHSMESSLRFGQLEQDSLLNQFRVNSIGPVLVAQALADLLRKAPAAKVLNVSSWLGSITIKKTGGNYGYAASKAALNMMNKALAEDLRADGIVCANFNPGWVQTDMGGEKAKLTPEQSVAGMLDTLDGLGLEDTGSFVQWDGSAHPW